MAAPTTSGSRSVLLLCTTSARLLVLGMSTATVAAPQDSAAEPAAALEAPALQQLDALWRGAAPGGSVVWQTFGRSGDPRPRVASTEPLPRWIVWEAAWPGPGVLERVSVDRPGARLWLELDDRRVALDPVESAALPPLHFGHWPFQQRARLVADQPHLQGLVRGWRGDPATAAASAALPTGPAPLPGILQRVDAAQPAGDHAEPRAVLQRTLRGPGVVRELRCVPGAADQDLHAYRLEITVDGTPTVDIALAAFLGDGAGQRASTSRYLGRDPDGARWCRLPIPFAESLALRLVAAAGSDQKPLRLELAWSSEPVETDRDRTLQVCLAKARAETDASHTLELHALSGMRGPLRLVGLGLSVSLATAGHWSGRIELGSELADPRAVQVPIETLFGGAWQRLADREGTWCSTWTTAASRVPGSGSWGFGSSGSGASGSSGSGTRALLWFGPGAAPEFAALPALRWGVRPWDANDLKVESIAYCYVPLADLGTPHRVDDHARVAPQSAAREDHLAAGEAPSPSWFEGEQLQAIGEVPGRIDTQDLRSYAGGRWSRDAHLFWTGPKPGDRLVLGVPVAQPGRYVLQMAMTTARDYGQFRIRFAGQPMGETLELYTPEVRATGLCEVGRVEIPTAGMIPLEIEVVGKHPKAVAAYLFGLDAVRLIRLR